MNKVNYDKEMIDVINALNGEKKRLLLHCCCAPCSTACIERLKDYFDLTLFFYNPNMDTNEEYVTRQNELTSLCNRTNVSYIIAEYNPQEFYSVTKGLENEREGGARCKECFSLRLEETAKKAKARGFDFFTTTLTISPLKNSRLINEIGLTVGESVGVKFLPSDFKKQGGYLRSIELSKQFNLYRQNYCGCVYSKREDGLDNKN